VISAGTPIKMVAIYAMSLALNVILNLRWMPRWGPAGASLASTTSYGVPRSRSSACALDLSRYHGRFDLVFLARSGRTFRHLGND
jgi:O-antigen/teichoic acid export membrane protein